MPKPVKLSEWQKGCSHSQDICWGQFSRTVCTDVWISDRGTNEMVHNVSWKCTGTYTGTILVAKCEWKNVYVCLIYVHYSENQFQ